VAGFDVAQARQRDDQYSDIKNINKKLAYRFI
jgi:hypothetical protein